MANRLESLRTSGGSIIECGGPVGSPLPLEQQGVVFRQMFEYSVADFETEVGFYSTVFGFSIIAMTEDYALFSDVNDGFCLSFRKSGATFVEGLKLLFMTRDIDAAEAHLGQTGYLDNRYIKMGSDIQRVIHYNAPSGLAIEIWEMPSDG